MSNIKLQSSDGKIFEVDEQVAKQSTTIKTMLELLDSDSEVLPLLNVNSTILKKVIEWAEHHCADPPYALGNNRKTYPLCSDDIEEWDANFIDMDQATRFELIMAANFLDIQGLLDLGCKAVANTIKGKSADEIRIVLNISGPDKDESDQPQHKVQKVSHNFELRAGTSRQSSSSDEDML